MDPAGRYDQQYTGPPTKGTGVLESHFLGGRKSSLFLQRTSGPFWSSLVYKNICFHVHDADARRDTSRNCVTREPPFSLSPDGTRLAFVLARNSYWPTPTVHTPADSCRTFCCPSACVVARRQDHGRDRLGNASWPIIWCDLNGPRRPRRCRLLSLASALGAQLGPKHVCRRTGRPLSARNWFNVGRIDWVPDGSGLLFDGSEGTSDYPSQLWLISFPNGEVSRITNDLTDYRDISVAANSTIVTTQQQLTSSTWVLPAGNLVKGRPILPRRVLQHAQGCRLDR